MINFNVPDNEMPADVYLNDQDKASELMSFQNSNNILAQGPFVPSAKPINENTGGQSLNQMKA